MFPVFNTLAGLFNRSGAQPERASVILGRDDATQALVTLAPERAQQHILVTGVPGSGAGATVLDLVRQFMVQGLPVLYVDGLGESQQGSRVQAVATSVGRTSDFVALELPDQADAIATALAEVRHPGRLTYMALPAGEGHVLPEVLRAIALGPSPTRLVMVLAGGDDLLDAFYPAKMGALGQLRAAGVTAVLQIQSPAVTSQGLRMDAVLANVGAHLQFRQYAGQAQLMQLTPRHCILHTLGSPPIRVVCAATPEGSNHE